MEFRGSDEFQQLRTKAGVDLAGPVFVSIGKADQLRFFLERNTGIPPSQIFVDDYDHNSYRETMGFTRFDEIASVRQLRGIELSKLVVPLLGTLGIPKLIDYVRNFLALAPVEGDLDWRELPEGGLRNGGTIVVGGIDRGILYRWNDKIPGDVPNPRDVCREAEKAYLELDT